MANEKTLNHPAERLRNDEMDEIEGSHAENIQNYEASLKKEEDEMYERDSGLRVSTGCGPSPDREVGAVIIEGNHQGMSSQVSTGCGPSPDREIEEIFANEHIEDSIMKSFTPLREVSSRSSKVSIGTSPPPQSTSTQVIITSE